MMGIVDRVKTCVTHVLHFTPHRKFLKVTKMILIQVTAQEELRNRLSKGGREQVVQLTLLMAQQSGPFHLLSLNKRSPLYVCHPPLPPDMFHFCLLPQHGYLYKYL